ncbi:MAG: HAMP domain-containing protein [Xanthomonadales bacterium]|nr:HAMP domain-containing protein [Gammaproteobacteria bacterium]NNK05290.1 HAMP domain-containing protein [Xanthomonadales bacterium]
MVEMRNSLKFKVGFYLLIALTIAVFVFSMVLVRNNREALLQQVIGNSAQLSQVVIRSTRFAMLQNKPSQVNQIIQDVGDQQEIEKVRILSKDGTIIHSSKRDEIGTQVDQQAESCLACHMDEKARNASPKFGRSRFFTSDNGKRMLGSTAVIPNEASCAGAGCHASPDDESVLGVLDIIYPLDDIDATLRANTYTVFGLSFGFILLASLLVSYMINRMVYLPLRDLDDGADKLAAGDLGNKIPVRSKDEFGHLAESFNSMTEALRKSRVDLEEWGRTLEKKVEEARHELELAHAEAARSEKLASVGLLAAGIAHELNNPLTGVLTFSHLVRKNLPDDSRDAEDLDLVIRETKRCASIIRRLLDFSREKTPEKAYGDLNAIIKDTLKIVEQPAQVEDIELVTDLDENLPPVWLDENLIKQVIMNMLVNARHAIGRDGRITISTRLRRQEECPEAIADAGDFAEITIADTGCGIPEQDLQKVFDPFFTTKDVGRGTGLGLSVSYGTVESHRGTIEVDSVEGEGTEFRIYLAINKKNDLGTSL